jgi:hypothetical protein
MKYQFQFAGVNMDRPVPQQQRRKRWVVFGVVLLVAALAYWQYLYRLSHGHFMFLKPHPVPPPAAAPAKVTAPPLVPAAEPPAMKTKTETAIASVAAPVAEPVNAPAVPAPQTASVQPAAEPAPVSSQTVAVAPVTAPVIVVSAKPKAHKPKAPESPEQRLQRAGQMAFDNMLNQANKYPDAYGFTADDIFSETKMGAAIPVYTISETDRAAYQAGRPVEELLKPANQWVFPVYAGGRLCCMVQVSSNGHEYIPGGATKFLAMSWNKIAERWPPEDGYHPRLVVNPDLPGYYFTIPEMATPNITDTFQMFYLHPSLSPADVILASWR